MEVLTVFVLDIPGYGLLELKHFVTDFSGTLSEDGIIMPGVKEKLNELARKLKIHVLTSDTFGRAREELQGINCIVHVLEGEDHTAQKESYVKGLGAERVAALGNGNNDSRMLRAAKLGIVLCLREGCSRKTFCAAQVFVASPIDAIELFLYPKRLTATLRV
jgi:soluble P-type ATPase